MISDSIFSKALVGVLLLVLVGCGSGDNTPPDIDGDGVEAVSYTHLRAHET